MEKGSEAQADLESMTEQLNQYRSMQDMFERRILDLQHNLKEKEEKITQLEEENTQLKNNAQTHTAAGKLKSESFPTDQTQQQYPEGNEPEQIRKLFIGGLNINTTDESLRSYFCTFGTIDDCVVLKDATGRSRCFGFVVYSTSAMVDIAQAARPHVLDGKTVDTKRATPKGEETTAQAVRKIFVGGLSRNTTKESICSFFEQFGGVSDVDCPLDQKSGLGRGFAYVTFNDTDPVDKVSLIHYHMIDGRRCEAKKALSKQEMSQQRGGGSMGGRGGGGGGGRGAGGWGRGGGGGAGGRGGRGRARGAYGGAPSYGGQSSWGNEGGWSEQGYGESAEQWSGDGEWGDSSQGWYSNGASAGGWNTGTQEAAWGAGTTAGGPMREASKYTQRYGGPYGQAGDGTGATY